MNEEKTTKQVVVYKEYISNVLTLILIIVTVVIGWLNIESQKEMYRLQSTIYKAKFIPSEVSPPLLLTGEESVSIGIANYGYVSGRYEIEITSNEFYFDFKNKKNKSRIKLAYILAQSDEDYFEVKVNLPKDVVKSNYAKFKVSYSSSEGLNRQKLFCYRLNVKDQYEQISCNS